MNPITSSHKFISLKATSSASNVFMKECWKWFFHVPFTLLPARALSLFVLEEYYHLPVFMPWSSLKEFPAYSNMVTCHEKSSKEEGKCWPIKKVNKKNECQIQSNNRRRETIGSWMGRGGFPGVESSCGRHWRGSVDLGILSVKCRSQTIKKRQKIYTCNYNN